MDKYRQAIKNPLCYCLLNDTVCDGRDTKLSYPSVWLGDFHSPDRRRGILPLSDPLYQFLLMFL